MKIKFADFLHFTGEMHIAIVFPYFLWQKVCRFQVLQFFYFWSFAYDSPCKLTKIFCRHCRLDCGTFHISKLKTYTSIIFMDISTCSRFWIMYYFWTSWYRGEGFGFEQDKSIWSWRFTTIWKDDIKLLDWFQK